MRDKKFTPRQYLLYETFDIDQIGPLHSPYTLDESREYSERVKISKLRSGEVKPRTKGELLNSLPELRVYHKQVEQCLSDELLKDSHGFAFLIYLSIYIILLASLFKAFETLI